MELTPVDRETFYTFLHDYPRRLLKSVVTITEPPMVIYEDGTKIVATHLIEYGKPKYDFKVMK